MASFALRSTRIAGVLALVAAAVISTGVQAFGASPVPAPEPHFKVIADPRIAGPGQLVIITLTSLDSRFTIVDCLVAFPSQDGGRCRRSPGRWFAETTVPLDARPGPMMLRWGIAARDADGRAAADNGSIEYDVVPPRSSSPSQTSAALASPHTVPVTHPHARGGRMDRVPALVAPDPPAARPGDSAPAVAAIWGRRLQAIGGSVLGAVLLALPFAFGGVRSLIRRRWQRWRRAQPNRPEDVESGDQVEVTPIAYATRSAVLVRDHDRWPVHLTWALPSIDPHLEVHP